MFVLRSVEQEVNVVLGPAGMTKAVSDFAARQQTARVNFFDLKLVGPWTPWRAAGNGMAAAESLGLLTVINLTVRATALLLPPEH
jgi:hypothetical protein